jgi:hypothetical protein
MTAPQLRVENEPASIYTDALTLNLKEHHPHRIQRSSTYIHHSLCNGLGRAAGPGGHDDGVRGHGAERGADAGHLGRTELAQVERVPAAAGGGAVRAAGHELGQRDLRRRRRGARRRARRHERPRLRLQHVGPAAHVPAGRRPALPQGLPLNHLRVRRADPYHGRGGLLTEARPK